MTEEEEGVKLTAMDSRPSVSCLSVKFSSAKLLVP